MHFAYVSLAENMPRDSPTAWRVAEYVYGCNDTHHLVLAPKILELISSADVSYAEHPDGKSHSGGVVGSFLILVVISDLCHQSNQ
jgi:hypothetical protein